MSLDSSGAPQYLRVAIVSHGEDEVLYQIAGTNFVHIKVEGITWKQAEKWGTFSVGKLLTTRGVQTGPGAIQLQRMPFSATSSATPLVNVTIAPCNNADSCL